jgi:hypothetical protein
MRFAVEEGHVQAFCRAVGEQREGVVPPTFTATTSLHDPKHLSGAAQSGEGESVLHAEQHFEYLAPVRVHDVLAVTEAPGKTWTKQSRSGGTLTFTELVKELRDEHGMLVVRSRMVLVSTTS